MVQMHYAAEQVNPITHVLETAHTRAVFSSVDDAIAQAAEDLAQGLNPIGVFEYDKAISDELWDGTPDGKTYNPDDWVQLVGRAELHKRAGGTR